MMTKNCFRILFIPLMVMTFLMIGCGGGDNNNNNELPITNTIGMTFNYISPGTFTMSISPFELGRIDDETQRQVTLTSGYYMQTTEVTQGQWWQVMGTDPSSFDDCGDNCPVETVSWDEAQAFIEELNRREATNGYRLPTEAQWEYACRAGTTTPFSFGECLSTSQANYDGDYPYTGCSSGTYRKTPIAVASLGKNAWGLYDMHGNVWEWCSDWYGSYSSAVPRPDPEGPTSGNYRVIRGGSWNIGARSCRSANRNGVTPDYRPYDLGFRVVMLPGQ